MVFFSLERRLFKEEADVDDFFLLEEPPLRVAAESRGYFARIPLLTPFTSVSLTLDVLFLGPLRDGALPFACEITDVFAAISSLWNLVLLVRPSLLGS